MVILDTLSGEVPGVEKRWKRLLHKHRVDETDALIICKLRCSLLHGYGLPTRESIGYRKMILDDNLEAAALKN